MNYNKQVFYDHRKVKDVVILVLILLGFNVLILEEFIIYLFIGFYIFWREVIFSKIGVHVDKWFFVKKRDLSDILNLAVMAGLFITLILKYTIIDSSNPMLITSCLGVIFILIGLFFLTKKDSFKIRKGPDDYENLKQEEMYQLNIDVRKVYEKSRIAEEPIIEKFTKKRFFGLWNKEIKRVKRNSDGSIAMKKIVDYVPQSKLVMVDDKTGKLSIEAKKEITDIINSEKKDFYNYSLTIFKDDNEAEAFIKKLELDEKKMIKPRHRRKGKEYNDGLRFARFWYQEMLSCFKSVSTPDNPLDYDFRAALRKFDGVFEYAFLDMYRNVVGYKTTGGGIKNRPIGNTHVLAELDLQFSKREEMKELCGAMDSMTNTSVKRRGAAYITGYLKTLEDMGVDYKKEG